MLKIGVLGAGHLGKIHIRLLKESTHYELVGFYDTMKENAARVEEELGVKAWQDVDALMDAVDVVDVVTPTTHHFTCVMKAFDSSEFNKHKAEAKERWGKTDAYKEHEEKTKGYSKDKWNNLADEMNEIMAAFAACMKEGNGPASAEAQNFVKMLQDHITKSYYHCTDEILFGLGQMYVADERFKQNIDKHGEGKNVIIFRSREAADKFLENI